MCREESYGDERKLSRKFRFYIRHISVDKRISNSVGIIFFKSKKLVAYDEYYLIVMNYFIYISNIMNI